MTPIRRMAAAMAGQRRELALAGLIGTLAAACAVALLATSAWLISRAAEAPPVLTLTVAAVMVRAFALGRAFLRYGERLVGHDAAFRGLADLRVSVFERLERLAPVGLARFSRGDLLSRLVADVDAALDLPLRIALPWAQAALVSTATVALCIWLVPSAGLLIGILAVLGLTVVPWLVGALAHGAEQRMAPAKALLAGSVVTALDATADLIAFGQVPAATQHVSRLDDALTKLTKRSSFALGFGGGVSMVLQGAGVTGALLLAVPKVVDGTIAPVWLAVIVLLPLALFEVISGLPASALAFQRLRGSADRLTELVELPDPITPASHPRALPPGFSGLEMRGVGARWNPDAQRVLIDINVSIAPQEHVVIVGPSGSGKSTLAAVLMGFLAYEGSIALNGVEIALASGDELRERIGLLSQRCHLFATSVGENIRLGRLDVTDEQVWRALAAAQLDDAVRAMPDQLQTQVGTFGIAVSGGEAQRLSLARLLVDPRPVVILDEPTEHLDAQTARDLERTLRETTAGSTRIVISHRLSLIDPGDRVIVLQAGRVVAEGTAAELATRQGWFLDRLGEELAESDMSELIESLPPGRGMDQSPLRTP